MFNLKRIIGEWGKPGFFESLGYELEKLGVDQLPLQQGLSLSNFALDTNIKVIVLNSSEQLDIVIVKVGIFYTGIIAGCHCADDPSPIDQQSEYCEAMININKSSGNATANLI